ncbi:MAG TPA: amidohydrolase family protein [Bryobacteraceae bacterium]|nr:amidohydrolase family protein [Bryobacteraceae bacterium]
MKILLWMAALLAAALPGSAAAPAWAITNARVVTGPEKTIERGVIVLRNGLIEAVGESVAIPADARVFDANGITVYPGLIDGATHYGFPAAARTTSTTPAESTPAPASPSRTTAATTPEDIAAPHRYLRPKAAGINADVAAAARMTLPNEPDARRNQGFTTVLAVPRDGHWQGTSALVNLAGTSLPEAVVAAPVAMHVSLSTAGFGRTRSYPTSLMGAIAALRQSLINAQQYREALKLYEQSGRRGLVRPAFDRASAALLPVLDGTIPVVFTADTEEEIRRVLRFADEFRLRPIIAGGREAWKAAEELKARDIPVLVRASLTARMTGIAPDAEAPRTATETREAEANPGLLEKAGVRFALVSADWERPSDFFTRVRYAIDRGLSRAAALRAVTLGPAEILGAGQQLGTIEPDKIANLTLLDGPLFEPRTRVKATVIDGQFYYPTATPPQRGVASAAKPAAAAPEARKPPGPTPDDPTPSAPAEVATVDDGTSTARKPPVPEPAPKDLVIRNATILTVTNGTIENGSVWVQDGKIRAVGRTVSAPEDAKVIDGSGRFVMPGIIDSHSHAAIDGGVNESGPSVTAQVRVSDVLDPQDVNLYRHAAGGTTTLNILHGSANAIGGQNATVKVKYGRRVEDLLFPGVPRGIKMALGENPKRSNFTPGSRYPATRMGVENVIRESFKAAREYAREWATYREPAGRGEKVMAPEQNLTLETLADVLAGKVLVHAHCYRADEISMLLDLADEFGFRIRSLQHVLEGYKVAEKIRRHGAGASTFADMWGYKMEAFDGTPYNAALLVRAGVRTAINSDSSERARRLYQDAAKAMKYGGISENEAMRLITTEPAWMLGIEKRVGAIEPGMDADLAVFNAHPFSPYARVEMTIVDGQVVFDRERDLKHRVPWKESLEPEPQAPPAAPGPIPTSEESAQ